MTLFRSIDVANHGVRDGRIAPVTCAACGCRLAIDASDPAGLRWYHYSPLGGRDARGCSVSCVDLPHDRQGLPAHAH